MASKEREIEILKYKIDKDKKLVANWVKFGVSQRKIDAMENKITRLEEELQKLEGQ